ncbi:alpha-ketoglutarate-dependent dioxygenase alkB homolog 3 isoform 1-T3 [Macrochelys suwanniensis]
MEDKRRRARVQGGWAGPVQSRTASLAAPGASAARNLVSVGTDQKTREQFPPKRQFVFKEPAEVERKAPEPRVIDEQGLHEISTLPTGVSRVHLIPGFIDSKQADWMFEQLLQEIPWRQRTHLRQDLSYKEPRLTSWYGELPYTYSKLTMQPNPNWHPLLTMLKEHIEKATGHTFNSLLCNLYRNEKDSVDWHSDDEPSLGRNPVIASLSFGATRIFEMRKKPPPPQQTVCLPSLPESMDPGHLTSLVMIIMNTMWLVLQYFMSWETESEPVVPALLCAMERNNSRLLLAFMEQLHMVDRLYWLGKQALNSGITS